MGDKEDDAPTFALIARIPPEGIEAYRAYEEGRSRTSKAASWTDTLAVFIRSGHDRLVRSLPEVGPQFV